MHVETDPELASPRGTDPDPESPIYVVLTTSRNSLKALAMAGRMARGRNYRIVVLVAEVVPFALPLDEPHIDPDFTAWRVQELVQKAGIDAEVRVCLCRRPEQIVTELAPRSSVVLCGRSLWWPTVESRLARVLNSAGHPVIVANR